MASGGFKATLRKKEGNGMSSVVHFTGVETSGGQKKASTDTSTIRETN